MAARGACAAARDRPPIGVLSPLSVAAAARNIEALRLDCANLGMSRVATLSSSTVGRGNARRLPELAAELVALNPDVICAGSAGGILAAHKATRTIPLVLLAAKTPSTWGWLPVSLDPAAMLPELDVRG